METFLFKVKLFSLKYFIKTVFTQYILIILYFPNSSQILSTSLPNHHLHVLFLPLHHLPPSLGPSLHPFLHPFLPPSLCLLTCTLKTTATKNTIILKIVFRSIFWILVAMPIIYVVINPHVIWQLK